MTAPDTGHTGQPQAKSAVTIRAVSWALLAMLLALLTNNVLNLSPLKATPSCAGTIRCRCWLYLIPMLAAILIRPRNA